MTRVSRIQSLLALMLLLGAIGALWPVAVDAAPSFSILSTSTTPDPTTPGSTATVTTSIKNNGTLASGIIVDMEIYNSAGKKVAQDYLPANTFAAGETKTFNFFWTTSGSQAGGTHTVKIGIFADHWSSILLWNNSADTFMVANSSPGVAFSIGNVTANPTSFAPGGTVSVTAVVTNTGSSGASGINVMLHLTDPLGNDDFPNNQMIIENQSFAAHQTKTITFQHHSASNARQGAYTVGIGVFNASWSQLYAWKNSPSAFTIGTAAQLTFTIGTTTVQFLDTQSTDLEEAVTTLEDAIRKIDRESRELLRETFETVNRHLATLFPTLFGGGDATLTMTGEEILDAGVQIMAHPPGKRNTSIHLLSGGEKALTAIALVFSLFQLNPAPFCLLDEVDAPLDDSNTLRFCDLVKRMSAQTQFLFISHNKISMEMASQLVGVTMPESGVSRVVAVDIEEALRIREELAA